MAAVAITGGRWLRSCIVKGAAVLLTAATLTGCSSGAVVNTGDTPQYSPAPATTSAPQYGTANLVDAAEYARRADGRITGYYFSTPSGRWRCAILPRDRAGCESAAGLTAGVGVADAPEVEVDGRPTAPNAIAVDRDHDAGFVALTESQFADTSATTLPFGKVLAAAGFRCNVQEASGVSCVRELTGYGFTFSGDGYSLHYTDVP